MYDFLVVGAGLYGSVFAHQATLYGKKCLVIDRRNQAGGNIACENIEGINVHRYGPHIFHTNDLDIWNFVNKFVQFKNFIYSPLAFAKGRLYNLPFNMNTFHQVWGPEVVTPDDAMLKIRQKSGGITWEPNNLEEQAIKLIGTELYKLFVKGYTEKQWGRSCQDLPAFIIKRIPLRFTFDNNYFNDTYQGIPIGGYNKLIDGLLKGIEVRLCVDFFKDREWLFSQAKQVVYTGPIDQFFDFRFGNLEYRSLKFFNEVMKTNNFQGNAVINYTDAAVPFTRVIEHKHFEGVDTKVSVVTYEYPSIVGEKYYPINDLANGKIFKRYKAAADQTDVIFGGRLAEYRYYDMHQVIGSALATCKRIFNREQ